MQAVQGLTSKAILLGKAIGEEVNRSKTGGWTFMIPTLAAQETARRR